MTRDVRFEMYDLINAVLSHKDRCPPTAVKTVPCDQSVNCDNCWDAYIVSLMDRIKEDTAFEIGDYVRLKDVNIIARIDAITHSMGAPEYRCVYWNDGTRYNQWVNGWEIEAEPIVRR